MSSISESALRVSLDLDVVVEVDAQLADECAQDALEEFVDREYREPRIVVQNLGLYASGALHDLGLVEAEVAFQVGHVAALGGADDQIVYLFQDAAFHLLGSLVGERHGEDGAIEIGFVAVVFYRVVHEFVCQPIGLARSGARAKDLCSHGVTVCR